MPSARDSAVREPPPVRRWPPDHMSASAYSLLLDCARRYGAEYRDGLRSPRTGPLILGSAVDRAIEVTLRQRWALRSEEPLGAVDGAWLEAAFREALASQLDQRDPIDWGQETATGLLEDGLALVTSRAVLDALGSLRLASGRDAGSTDDGPALQHRIELGVPGVPVPVVGFVDAVARSDDGRVLTITDFKVSRRRWNAKKARAELQPRIYTAALRQRGLPLSSLRFRYLIFVRSPLPQSVVVQALDAELTEADLYATLDTLRDGWRGVEAGVFPANPSSWRCGSGCPVWRAGQCLGAGWAGLPYEGAGR